jgi:hypothetical protein
MRSVRYVTATTTILPPFARSGRARQRLPPGALPRHPALLFGKVVEQLAAASCDRGARIIVEKPFGSDLATARSLNRVLLGVFEEKAIFRIDHYLGKPA